MRRVICYVDGFNLYHAIDQLNKPHLKWVCLRSLAGSVCREGEVLSEVRYFSAFATWLPHKMARHRLYVQALETTGVVCSMARFSEKTMTCRKCGSTWRSREEKETDVHFALTFLEDAFTDRFDRALILSADSDYVPAVRTVRSRFPQKEVFFLAPPKRRGHGRELEGVCHGALEITAGRLSKSLLPERIDPANGSSILRPTDYDWPEGWAPPT